MTNGTRFALQIWKITSRLALPVRTRFSRAGVAAMAQGMMVPRDRWFEIVTYFDAASAKHPGLKPLADLVQQVATSKFSNALYPWNSVHDLCLAQTAATPPGDSPYLRLRLISDGAVEFRYVNSALESHQWCRVEPAELAFGRLLIFFDQLNWFGPEPERR